MTHVLRCLALATLLLAGACPARAADDPDVLRFGQRLAALRADPRYSELAAYEVLQAQQAVQALATAKRRDREQAVYAADRRIEIAETMARAQAADREAQQLERTRGDLLVEASRREADRARQETERLRIQAQIQAEEADRMRQEAEAEAQARQEAEDTLTSVAGQQTAKLSAAKQKQAALAREEAELVSGAKLPVSRFNAAGEVFTFTGTAYAAGQAKLSSAAASQAKALAAYLQTGKAKARIEAYDSDAKTAQARADALRAALVAAGASGSRIQAVGKKAPATKARAAEVILAQ